MLSTGVKYLPQLQKTMLIIAAFTCFTFTAFCQDDLYQKDAVLPRLSPVLTAAIKNPKPGFLKIPHANPPYKTYKVRPDGALMRWPNYPLTAQQIEARQVMYDRSIGRQIAESILESYVTGILKGRKPVARIPKF